MRDICRGAQHINLCHLLLIQFAFKLLALLTSCSPRPNTRILAVGLQRQLFPIDLTTSSHFEIPLQQLNVLASWMFFASCDFSTHSNASERLVSDLFCGFLTPFSDLHFLSFPIFVCLIPKIKPLFL